MYRESETGQPGPARRPRHGAIHQAIEMEEEPFDALPARVKNDCAETHLST
jgi:hypothetical protein